MKGYGGMTTISTLELSILSAQERMSSANLTAEKISVFNFQLPAMIGFLVAIMFSRMQLATTMHELKINMRLINTLLSDNILLDCMHWMVPAIQNKSSINMI
jgi:hypothetical protein